MRRLKAAADYVWRWQGARHAVVGVVHGLPFHGATLELEVPVTSHVGAILRRGSYEPELLSLIERSVRPGDTVIDVGANVGVVAATLAVMVGPEGRVVAFDPLAHNLACLRRNLDRNSLLDRVEIHQCALGPANETVTLSVPIGNAEYASLLPDLHRAARAMPRKQVEVTMRRLDDIEDLRRRAPRLIKLDVEGAEPEVIEGGRGLIAAGRPVIVFECNVSFMQRRPAAWSAMFDFLGQCGYRLRDLGGEKDLVHVPGQLPTVCSAVATIVAETPA